MRIQNALIGWNAPIGDRGPDDPARKLPRVIVVDRGEKIPRGWGAGYKCSDGACGVEWRKMSDAQAVQAILLLFRSLVLQGIPALVVHRAFFVIDGYRRAGGWDMSLDGDVFNP